MQIQGTQNSQNILKKELSWRTHTSNFKNFYKTTIIKTLWYCHKDRHIDQKRNRIQNSEINSYIYGQLIFHKGAKIIQQGKMFF